MGTETQPGESRVVLVTGGAGFIGSNLVNALVGRGLSASIVDNITTGSRSQVDPRAELSDADIRDLKSNSLRVCRRRLRVSCGGAAAGATVDRKAGRNAHW